MKKSLHIVTITILLVCSYTTMFSQQITVDNTVGLQPLIEDNLVDGCVKISNITSSVSGISHGLPSYGYFEKGSSNFPFKNGIMLATGNAASAGNGIITPTLSEGSTIWETDPDIETSLGITNTVNATSIEFDIVSISSQFQFNYLFASEDYDTKFLNPCISSDGFVCLIKETGSALPYQNIALVPGTSTPITTNTIHTSLLPACDAENEQYFDDFNIGDTNYIGRTTVLNASTTITPNVSYHVKLIIADHSGSDFDSAVFIEGGSFKILDLGEDISTCSSSVELDANINNPLATYKWFFDGVEIPGAVGETYTTPSSQTGTYKAIVSVALNGTGTPCPVEDEIFVDLNTETPITAPIDDYELCDNNGGNGTGVTFDLDTRNSEFNDISPFPSFFISYHDTEAGAKDPLQPGITSPIQNTNPRQTIHVRLDDSNSECFAYTQFDLVVNAQPDYSQPTSIDECDNTTDNSDGFTIIDLIAERTNDIINGRPNLEISYHTTSQGAIDDSNLIENGIYLNYTPQDEIFVRIFNTKTGCVSTTNLIINVTEGPKTVTETIYQNACDTNLDGSAIFDLTEKKVDFLNGLSESDVEISYFENETDARDINTTGISNPEAYQYDNATPEPGSGEIYVRIQDKSTGCFSIVLLEIHTNLLLTAAEISEFAICNFLNGTEDTLEVFFSPIEDEIIEELELIIPNTNFSITFYETAEDIPNNNPITAISYPVSVNEPKTLFVKIDDGNCPEILEIKLRVDPILEFKSSDPVTYCDTDEDVILETLNDIITNNNTDFLVEYYLDASDATLKTNEIETISVIAEITLFARIESKKNPSCYTINEFTVKINEAPEVITPAPIIVCNIDATDTIDLTDKIDDIIPNEDPSNFNITFYTYSEDNDTYELINNETSFPVNADTKTIRVIIENKISSPDTDVCSSTIDIDVIANSPPEIQDIEPFTICQLSDTADFTLEDKDAEILNGETDKEVYYFENQDDASDPDYINKQILKTAPYPVTGSKTIFVRVEYNTAPSCFSTSSFSLNVFPFPEFNKPAPFLLCDDSNDNEEIFDLSTKIDEMKNGITNPDNLVFTFHSTDDIANNYNGDTNEALPELYTNVDSPQIIHIRIQNKETKCYIVEKLTLGLLAIPTIELNVQDLTVCDEDNDSNVTFNLDNSTSQIFTILNGKNTNTNYYENINDINTLDPLDNTGSIPDPLNFSTSFTTSDTKTIFIKVTAPTSKCYNITPLNLKINHPPVINNITNVPVCDNNTKSIDLSAEVNPLLVNDTSIVNISYYTVNNNVAIDIIDNMYNYTTTGTYPIFARIEDNISECFTILPFNLNINPNPVATIPPITATEKCDDDYDGSFPFNLTNNGELSNAIRGNLNASTFSVTYYDTLDKAENNDDAVTNGHLSEDGDIIFARLENIDTGCYSTTQFTVSIHPLPIINVEDIEVICINDLPRFINADTGNAEDTYYWHNTLTNRTETTPEIELNLTDVNNGWSLTITRPSTGCNETKTFEVIQSVEATIDFTPTVDFSDPNSITVIINTNSIGNYVYILDSGEPQSSNFFNNVAIGPHIVTVRDLNGCEDVSQDVMVVDVPKFVTPNGDGHFDTWHITGVNQLTGTIIKIYSRHGKLLKTLPHTSIGWNGTYNGQNMPSDDYWYVGDVFYKGTEFQMKGHFSLKR